MFKIILLRLLFGVAVVVVFPGCILAPFIGSVKNSGILEEDRARLLVEEVNGFYSQMRWGEAHALLRYIEGSRRKDVVKALEPLVDGLKIVDSKIVNYDFLDSSYSAEVIVSVRYYKSPYYIVKDRKDVTIWSFTLSDGWKLQSVKQS